MHGTTQSQTSGDVSHRGLARAGATSVARRALLSALCVGAGATLAGASAREGTASEPLEHEFTGAHAPLSELEFAVSPPRLSVEIGRSPTRAAFAVDIRGGAPHAWALLHLRDEGGACASELVRLDESGAARRLRLDHRADGPIAITCTLPVGLAAGDGVAPMLVLTAKAPSAAEMLAQSRALAGWGAPGSPFAALGTGASGVVITEIMKDPSAVSDSAGEWFEVRNLGATAIDLTGWSIRDAGSNSHTIAASANAVIPPRSYFVFGINANPALNGGVTVGYKYSNFTLGNGADDIQLYDASGALVDAVAYDDGVLWPDTPGKALNLQRALVDSTSNDDGANWCDALSPINGSSTDTGTPRLANNACP